MKFLRLDLLTLLIGLFIFASCKNPDSVGLGIGPNKALQANLMDTTTINTVTATEDSVLTSNDTIVPISYFKDPAFGTTETNFAASLSLPGDAAFTLPTGTASIDSAVLVLNYGNGFYGDLTSTFTMNVYQLTENFNSAQSYYSNKSWAHSPAVIGTKTFVPHPKDTLKITNIVTGGPDTLIKVVPQLRIPISKAFINSILFNNTNTSQLATNRVFENAVMGLYMSVNTSAVNAAHPGGSMFFRIASSARIDVYYKVTYTSANPDTLVATMPVGNYHAVELRHNYAVNTDITNQLLPANANGSFPNLYIQGLAGLRGKISFPYMTSARLLHDIRKSNLVTNPSIDTNSIVDFGINQAELHITPVTGSTIPYPPLQRLTLYRWDIAHQRSLVPDAYTADPRYLSVGSFGGFFDNYHQSYSFIITGYVDDLLRGKTTNYGTFIAPADTTGAYYGSATINTALSDYFTGRSVLGGNKTSAYKMKLNILYNKVTK